MRMLFILVLSLLFGLQAAEAKPKRAKHRAKPVAAAPYSPAAMEIFGAQKLPSPLAARSFGGYARGCIAGAKPLPIDGPSWQAMRLSRNRNWGHPVLVAYLERLAEDAKAKDNWPGLLVGDMAQPMGGPMLTGHASHQIGLDADVWLTPMPANTLSPQEREDKAATSMLAEDGVSVDPRIWSEGQAKLIKRAASYPEVARIFVHPAIKKALCVWNGDKKEPWLSKVRPWWGHHYHFHVRLACPAGSQGCINQPPAGTDDGCGKEVDSWLKKLKKPPVVATPPAPTTPAKPAKPKKPMTVAQLPAECAALVGLDKKPAAAAAAGIVPVDAVPVPERNPSVAKKSAEKSERKGG
ncbi:MULTISPECIES: penicillin-insensitive murein endopeptidase [Rhodomicrobium]|uniref:penicillin-insensitive murein endopeptidase n=1 Tax=Rhodomicrobium TaxID=1068 RepID=UPI001FDA33B9|nr:MULTISPECIES: penicillin-insensitive murein endopeptidase [Rhodomicrobium]